MWPTSIFTDRLGLATPILQAPMARAATPALAAAVSSAGGLGGLGCGPADVDGAVALIEDARRLGAHRLNANFFIHQPARRDDAAESAAAATIEPLAAELDVQIEPHPEIPFAEFGPAMVEALVELRLEVVTFHFDAPHQEVVDALHDGGIVVGGTATTVAEAEALEACGCDFVIAQGTEAGGHRGTFAPPYDRAMIGTFSLVPQVVDAVTLPVVAAGGIADGRGIAAALMLGAVAVQIGTAFLACPEALVSDAQRQAMTERTAGDTYITDALSGRPARAFRNLVVDAFESLDVRPAEFPVQFLITQPVRAASRQDFETEAMWTGQSFPLARAEPAAEVVARLVLETKALLGGTAER